LLTALLNIVFVRIIAGTLAHSKLEACALVLAVSSWSNTGSAQEVGGGVPALQTPRVHESPAQQRDSAAPVVVEVRGQSSDRRLRESAQAVSVVDTADAKLHSGDVAGVLTRTEGVTVQRSGGLGAQARLSLHGLTDDQIRVFLDGVPLELSGFGLGIAGIPLDWIDRIAVYRGVVPARYGADALGGAIDLTTDQSQHGSRASASYSGGAFDTHSLALHARTFHAATGLLARVAGFYDRSENDYVVQARVPDDDGTLRQASVRRFHDGYRAGGGMLEVGVVDKPWARKLALRTFATAFDKDLQHNLFMTVPYGAVRYDQAAVGGTVRYELPQVAGSPFGVLALAGYSQRTLGFRDTSRWVYDWFGRRVFERPAGSGELSPFATDLTQWEQRAIGRLTLAYQLAPGHTLRLISAPDVTARSGRERLRVKRERLDPLTTSRSIFQLVSGLEYGLRTLDDRVENSAFIKHYLYQPATNQVETFDDTLRRIEGSWQRFGAGDALRVRIAQGLLGKLSYEYATRLPRPDEVFGDGALVLPNATLQPESSHNGNLGVQLTAGQLSAEITAFLRSASDMIVRLPAADRVHALFQNVVDVSSRGLDGSVRWTSPRRSLDLNLNGTWLDIRNVSSSGPFSQFRGWRLPNRPWLIVHAAASFKIPVLDITATWATHYVHSFQPGWDSSDNLDESGVVPMQLVHNLSFVYSARRRWGIDLALDLTNLADARVYDVLGVQKPGRAAYFKITTHVED
jgi:vitamin B12 transporter